MNALHASEVAQRYEVAPSLHGFSLPRDDLLGTDHCQKNIFLERDKQLSLTYGAKFA